jgi:SAM-dependent methyltransferase
MPDLRAAPSTDPQPPGDPETDGADQVEDGHDAEPVYGARYYETYNGGAYEYEGHWAAFFREQADNIIRQFHPRTVLDAGCAKGFLVQALRERGVEAHGFDTSEYAIANAVEAVKPYVKVGSLTEPIEGRYDLVTCIEVIEHLEPAELPRAVASLCAVTDRILLSSTPDGEQYGEPSHLSLRPPEEWAALFSDAGFFRNLSEDVTWFTGWAMLLDRRPAMTVREVVRAYDRHMAEVLRENYELRRTTLHLERVLEDERAAGRQVGAAQLAELERLHALEERATEAMTQNLRLRDLLIVSERTLGQVRGENARLQDQLKGYDELASRHHAVVQSTTWRLAWKVLGPYRQARQRMRR